MTEPEVHYVEHSSYSYVIAERRDDDAIRYGECFGAEELWYWYASGSYEGDGGIILRGGDGRWGICGLGHCSCNDPLGDRAAPTWHATLADLVAREASDDAAPLLAVIGGRR